MLRSVTRLGNQWSRKLATIPLPASRLDSGRHDQSSVSQIPVFGSRLI